MKLYLLQHGDSLSKEQDPDRALSEKGRRDILQLTTFLKANDINFDKIFHSGKTRAVQSAEIVAQAQSEATTVEIIEDLAPNASLETVLNSLDNWPDNTLLVSHLPFLSKLASKLLGFDEEIPVVTFVPGILLCLSSEDGVWKIEGMFPPEF